MKHYLLSATVLFIAATGFSQEKKEKNDKPAPAAQAAFEKAFPGATRVLLSYPALSLPGNFTACGWGYFNISTDSPYMFAVK